jgi:phosphatidylglycerol---prolipoprotein diacylglyceryl transferase
MHPDLLTIGNFTLHTYGVLLACAFLVALWVAGVQAARAGLDRARITDLSVYALLAGIVGGKMALVIVDWRHCSPFVHALFWVLVGSLLTLPLAAKLAQRYARRAWAAWAGAAALALVILAVKFRPDHRIWTEIVSLVQSAGVFYGGFLAALIAAVWFARRNGLALWPTLDVLAPATAIGQAVGRLGCLAAGCCFGKHTDCAWAVTFRDPVAQRTVGTPLDVPLHPTQIYESLATLALFFLLLWLAPRKRFRGQVAATYLLGYALLRFVIEFFRGDDRGTVLRGALSTSQFVALLVALAVIALLPRLWKRQAVTAAAPKV